MCRSPFALVALFLLAASLAAAVTPIPGLPETVNGGKPVTITVNRLRPVLTFPAQYTKTIPDKAEIAVQHAFKQRYPNVTLQSFTYHGASVHPFEDNLISKAMTEGVGPDVMMVTFRQSGTYIRQGYLRPLDEQITQWRQSPADHGEFGRCYAGLLTNVCYRTGPDGRQHWYAIPPQTQVLVLYRLRAPLQAAGIDPEKPPKDWTEFYDQCLKVCNPRPDKDIWAFNLYGCWFLTHMLWSAGSELVGEKAGKPGEYEAKYNSTAAVRAFQFAWLLQRGPWAICPICDKHFSLLPKKADLSKAKYDFGNFTLPLADALSFTCPGCKRLWLVEELREEKCYFEGVCSDDMNKYYNDKIVFTISYLSDVVYLPGLFRSKALAISRVPADPVTGKSRSEVNSTMYGINGRLKDPGKIEAAWAYIRFRTSDEEKLIVTKVYVDNGYAGYLNPVWLRRFGYGDYVQNVNPALAKTYTDTLHNAVPEPYQGNAQQIYTEMDKAWYAIRQLKSPDPAQIKAILDANVQQVNARLFNPAPPAAPHSLFLKIATALSPVPFIILGVVLFIINRRKTRARLQGA